MHDNFQYRLTQRQKNVIAQNLIDIIENKAAITEDTRFFISNWILTGANEKRKAFYDVWDIVLKNYLPTTRPLLFRACKRIDKKNRIASFTGSLECARKFSKGKGYLIICDTNENLEYDEEISKPGSFKYTFYPLVRVLEKARESDGWGFSAELLYQYTGEDEYIMRVYPTNMQYFKYVKNE